MATPELMALVKRHQNPLKVQWFTSHRSLHIWKWWEHYETLKVFDVHFVKMLLSCWEDDDQEHFDIQDWKELKIQSSWMIKKLKIKERKETWNQASGVQVRGGLLRYEVKVLLCQSTAKLSTCWSRSKYCYLLKIIQSTSKNKDLSAILFKGLLCNIVWIF